MKLLRPTLQFTLATKRQEGHYYSYVCSVNIFTKRFNYYRNITACALRQTEKLIFSLWMSTLRTQVIISLSLCRNVIDHYIVTYVLKSLVRQVHVVLFSQRKPGLTHLWLPKDSVNSQNMVKYFIEQHQGHIQLFFIEHLSKRSIGTATYYTVTTPHNRHTGDRGKWPLAMVRLYVVSCLKKHLDLLLNFALTKVVTANTAP